MSEAETTPETVVYPPGEWAICELFGHTTLVGRIAETERFGAKMLAIEPLFDGALLPAVFHGGASIYRLTPCSAQVAYKRCPTQLYQLPPSIAAIVPTAMLPAPGGGAGSVGGEYDDHEDDDDRPL
jgi:hypothetical protein